MKRLFLSTVLLAIALIFPSGLSAQTDELRNATGLPIPIGEPAIYGRVSFRGLGPKDPKPSIYVLLFIGGIQADRRRTNDDGYYFFLTTARDGARLVFEADGAEVGSVVLTASVGSSVRRDITLDWHAFKNSTSTPGVISARSAYERSGENEKLFQRAMAAQKEKKPDIAASLFKRIVENDPKDFVSWTELGSVYFWNSNHTEAEAAYIKALEQKPDFMVALMNLGKLYLTQKQFEKASSVLSRAAAADPTSADAFHYLGESYLQAKLGSKAVIALNEAIRLAPDEKAQIHLRLAAL